MAGIALASTLSPERSSMQFRLLACAAVFSLFGTVAVGVQAQPTARTPQPVPVTAEAAPKPTTGQPVLDAHTREDIERHQSMARAHAQAAQCLEAGKGEDQCQKQLQLACKGLALGKNCGMRHSH